jgi:hypothetical protein
MHQSFFYNNIYIYLITKVLIIQPDNSKKKSKCKDEKARSTS